jgi:hypothetical protein
MKERCLRCGSVMVVAFRVHHPLQSGGLPGISEMQGDGFAFIIDYQRNKYNENMGMKVEHNFYQAIDKMIMICYDIS